jgi:hypothetical protein
MCEKIKLYERSYYEYINMEGCFASIHQNAQLDKRSKYEHMNIEAYFAVLMQHFMSKFSSVRGLIMNNEAGQFEKKYFPHILISRHDTHAKVLARAH